MNLLYNLNLLDHSYKLTGSTVLGFSLSEGFSCFTEFEGLQSTVEALLLLAATFPALDGGVLEPRDPADPRELVRLCALPECEEAIFTILVCIERTSHCNTNMSTHFEDDLLLI